MGDFQKLRVWQLSKDLAVEIYKTVNSNIDFKKDLRFAGQITSSAVSIPSNIAEGDELQTTKQGINHFYIAKGSCSELITQIIIGKEIGYIKEDTAKNLLSKANISSLSLYKLIQARKSWLK